jgi:hypothetical protein
MGNNLIIWYTLVQMIMHVRLNTNKDVFHWNLHQHENFSIHSMYLALITNGSAIRNTLIWRLKIPLKIKKKIMWYLQKEVVLTKGNLAKKNWKGGGGGCRANETIKHLFFIVIMLSLCGAYQIWCLT